MYESVVCCFEIVRFMFFSCSAKGICTGLSGTTGIGAMHSTAVGELAVASCAASCCQWRQNNSCAIQQDGIQVVKGGGVAQLA